MAIRARERKQWAKSALRGLENRVVPSLTPDLKELSEEGIRLDVRQSIKHGFFSTLCCHGNALTPAQHRRFIEVVTEEAGNDMLTGVPLDLDDQKAIIDLARHAEKAGCSHALLGFPVFYNPSTEDEIYRYVREICDSTDLGIILPAYREKVDFTHFHPSGTPFGLYDRLADIPNVIGLLVQSTEPGLISECFRRYSDRILVSTAFPGAAPLMVKAWGMQWSSGWIWEALQSPQHPYAVEFFNLLLAGDDEKAMQVFWQMAPGMATLGHIKGMFRDSGIEHFHLLKYYQWCVGGNGGMPPPPYGKLYQRLKDEIREAYRVMGITPTPDTEDNFFVGRAHYGHPGSAKV